MTLSELAYKISEIDHKYLSGILLSYITDFTIYEPFETLPSNIEERFKIMMEFIEEYERDGQHYAYIYANRQDFETI